MVSIPSFSLYLLDQLHNFYIDKYIDKIIEWFLIVFYIYIGWNEWKIRQRHS